MVLFNLEGVINNVILNITSFVTGSMLFLRKFLGLFQKSALENTLERFCLSFIKNDTLLTGLAYLHPKNSCNTYADVYFTFLQRFGPFVGSMRVPMFCLFSTRPKTSFVCCFITHSGKITN